eukprot:CAMPEP_0177694666 /NCGR_PEP_ID=MMETSP0484_2-20121128/3053_1 /TAXON_ID=354590 /ORGANISM="Rhodomonas lens, Strain RHODO" /LENGTH=584 /DNA_ID=CAMNT_0019205555 /DNA_START=28 /DNA_END=1783 /DNA_ORIENTATION=+
MFLKTWWGKIGVAAFAVHQYDTHFRYARFNRNVRSVGAAVATLVDYKIVLARKPESLEDLHERVAKRWYDVCCTNAGLYIKLGQQIATMNFVLPPAYQKYFSTLNDQAPSVDYATVSRIISEEFNGKKPEELFKTFDKEPIASASIAQVHKATLHDGTRVAVKVQKPEIQVQLGWDLACFRLLAFSFEKIFDMPMYWMVDTVDEAVRLEGDFRVEGVNAELCAQDVTSACLRAQSHVGAKHEAGADDGVDEGVKISDSEGLRKHGFRPEQVAKMMVDLFAHQIFISGFVHADPHPGNIFVRPLQANPSKPELVLLDHGSYLSSSEEFRVQLCDFWTAMVLMDTGRVEAICTEWGVRDAQLFASLQLLKPYAPEKNIVHLETTSRAQVLQMQLAAYERAKAMLEDSEALPRELIMLGRNLNIVRANNKALGSPVNRINIMARYAAEGAGCERMDETAATQERRQWFARRIAHMPPPSDGISREIQIRRRRTQPVSNDAHESSVVFGVGMPGVGRGKVRRLWFESQLFLLSWIYYSTQLWRSFSAMLLGKEVGGFEDLLEASVAKTVESQLGFKLKFDDGVEKCFG